MLGIALNYGSNYDLVYIYIYIVLIPNKYIHIVIYWGCLTMENRSVIYYWGILEIFYIEIIFTLKEIYIKKIPGQDHRSKHPTRPQCHHD